MKSGNDKELKSSLFLLAESSFLVFLGVILSKVFTYVYRAVIARNFGPEVYGLFSISLTVVGWFVVFSTFGITTGMLKYISIYSAKGETNKAKYVFKFTSKLLLTSGIISGILLFLLSEQISIKIFHAPELIIFLKLFSIAIPLNILSNMLFATMLAYKKIGWHSFIFNILQNAIKVITLILFIFLGLNINALIFSYILGLFACLLAAYLVSRYIIVEIFGEYQIAKKTKKKISKKLISFSWPFMFTGLVMLMFQWTDSFVLGVMKDTKSVGLYNAAIPIAFLIIITSELFLKLFFPLIVRLYANKRTETIKELSKQVGKWIFLINLPLLILIFLFPGVFINILFGPEFIIAENALRILSIGVFFSSIFMISQQLLVMKGKSKLLLIDTASILVLNIILNVLLIPRFGITGAAISTTASLILLNLIYAVQANYYLSIVPLRRKVATILLISIVPTSILLYLRSIIILNIYSLIILSILFFVLYILLMFITRALDRNDIVTIKSFLSKFTGAENKTSLRDSD